MHSAAEMQKNPPNTRLPDTTGRRPILSMAENDIMTAIKSDSPLKKLLRNVLPSKI